jgi:photosystem II stability/assembly factor-like uncharacterized protein
LHTMDGGQNWINSDSVFANNYSTLCAVNFPCADTGYVVGAPGLVLKTTDAGTTWIKQVSNTPNCLNSVSFVNTNTGYAVGWVGTIIKTTTGGANWMNLSSGTSKLNTVFAVNPNLVFIGDYDYTNSTIRKTSNGGMTWEILHPGFTGSIYTIYFINVDTGYAGCGGKIIKTINSGLDWTICYSGTKAINSIYFVNADTGYAVGGEGLAMSTYDGGTTWSTQFLNTSRDLNSVYFGSSMIGYAVGNGDSYFEGTIFQTIDGGVNWIRQIAGTYNDLLSVCFTDNYTGYAVGTYGTILKTINNGLGFIDHSNNSIDFTIHPNPATDHLIIEHGNQLGVEIKIYNVTGQMLLQRKLSQNSYELDITQLPKGLYLLMLTTSNESDCMKFLKE